MKPFQSAVPIAAATLLLVSGALGQTSNITSCVPQYRWTVNANGQTPCYVASRLHSACGFNVSYSAIPQRMIFTGPMGSSVNGCGCSSVVYALASACGACQGRSWSNMTNWFSLCPGGRDSQFPRDRAPSSSALDIPQWARLSLAQMANQTWDPQQAETFASTQPGITTTSVTSTPRQEGSSTGAATPTNSTETGSSNQQGEPRRSHAGAIAGGVVGGLIGLVVVGVGIFIWITRRRGRKIQHLDLTEQDTFAAAAGGAHGTHNGNNASWRKPVVPNSSTPPPVMSEKADSRDNHARHPSSASASSENRTHTHERKAATSPVYGMHRPQRSIDSLSKFSVGGHTTSDHRVVTPTGYTGAAEPYR